MAVPSVQAGSPFEPRIKMMKTELIDEMKEKRKKNQ
jgi:hypothetical protein